MQPFPRSCFLDKGLLKISDLTSTWAVGIDFSTNCARDVVDNASLIVETDFVSFEVVLVSSASLLHMGGSSSKARERTFF